MAESPCPGGGAVPTIVVFKRIDINECWSLDAHWDGDRPTPMGALVGDAKTYKNGPAGNRAAAQQLAQCMAWWARQLVDIEHHLGNAVGTRIGEASVVVPVPANPPKIPFNLPDVLAEEVAQALGVPCDRALVTKRRRTHEIKYETNKGAKAAELAGAFEVTRRIDGQIVIVVDDLVLSGATLEEIGRTLRAAGAERIIGLTATKAQKGLRPKS